MTTHLTRRTLLRAGLTSAAVLTAATVGCTSDPQRPTAPSPSPTAMPEAGAPATGRVLVVYFSRAGENYYNGGRRVLEVGNTEVLAGMIAERIQCDLYEIEAADPYPEVYDPTVERNQREQQDGARPEIAGALPDVQDYDLVLLGSPVWNVSAPMIMSTFIEAVDLSGKRVLPFVTYAVSGMAGIDQDYRDALPDAQVGTGLAVRGEAVADSGAELDEWLAQAGLA